MKSVAYLLLLGVVGFTAAQDYCSPDLCEPDEKHIACKHTGKFSKTCPEGSTLIQIDEDLQKLIVHLHNTFRNDIAGAKVKGYEGATRMASMTWNPELAKMATLHSKECQFEHDECHNTKKYKSSGQNLAQSLTTEEKQKVNVTNEVKEMIESWYDEKKDANMDVINNYPENWNGDDIGHFTQIIQAFSDAVGCSAMQMFDEEENMDSYMLTCNYARTNFVNKKVYDAGKPASKCETGTHPTYKYLCSSKEKFL